MDRDGARSNCVALMFALGYVALAILLLLPRAANAQSVRGVVVDAGDRPVAGVVVLLLDSTSQVTARALSNERGEFRVASSRPGSYRIRTVYIGFEPVMSEQLVLSAGGETAKRLVLRVAGGELPLARRGTDTLWRGLPLVLVGTLLDSLSGSPVAGARVAVSGTAFEATSDSGGRFAIPGMLPGQYTLQVYTPSLDSMSAVHQSSLAFTNATTPVEVRVPNARQLAVTLCGPAANRADAYGIVAGNVRLRDNSVPASAVRGTRVTAEWSADPADSIRVRRLEVRSTADGNFRLCGVPVNTAIKLSAASDSAETVEMSVVRIPSTARVARADLTLDRVDQLTLRGATFTGVVVADSTRAPISGAEVAIVDVGKTVLTDSRGAFTLSGIPGGEHEILVRRIGYGAANTRVMFNGHETLERRVVLGRAVVLETVSVSAKAIERAMASFEENRRLGLGHFMTRAELEKYTGMMLSGVVQQLAGVKVVNGAGGNAWITSKRAPAALCPRGQPGTADQLTATGLCLKSHGVYVPERFEAQRGVALACYALVYLDDVLMNGATEPTEPFDVNTIAPEQIEGIEFYAGAAQTPLKYSRMGSNCGVLVIWRRRSP
jgi:hypothetical protein